MVDEIAAWATDYIVLVHEGAKVDQLHAAHYLEPYNIIIIIQESPHEHYYVTHDHVTSNIYSLESCNMLIRLEKIFNIILNL